MADYEKLVDMAYNKGITVVEMDFSPNTKGLCINNTIGINTKLENSTEKACILAEELGHYYTTVGNITNLGNLANKKQEKRARNWACEKLITLHQFIDAYHAGCRNRYELSEFLEITESFLEMALTRFQELYGYSYKDDKYIITFRPLQVISRIDNCNEECFEG